MTRHSEKATKPAKPTKAREDVAKVAKVRSEGGRRKAPGTAADRAPAPPTPRAQRPHVTPDYYQRGRRYLQQKDPKLAEIIRRAGPCRIRAYQEGARVLRAGRDDRVAAALDAGRRCDFRTRLRAVPRRHATAAATASGCRRSACWRSIRRGCARPG